MKAIILAAGYATRLYPLTKNKPKSLLTIANKPIINYIIEKVNKIKEIGSIYVVTNAKFYSLFEQWSSTLKTELDVKIINDRTISNEGRLGSMGDLNFVIQQEKINEDILVIAGDNLFGFGLQQFLASFKSNCLSTVAFCDLKEQEKVKGRFGVGIIKDGRILDFEEKPLEPKSTLAATACYIFSKPDQEKIQKYVKENQPDALGYFIKYLMKHSEVKAFVFTEHWFDVGTLESLQEAEKFYHEN